MIYSEVGYLDDRLVAISDLPKLKCHSRACIETDRKKINDQPSNGVN